MNLYFDILEDLDEMMNLKKKRNAWSMVKLENLERSSRIFQVTLPLAECLARPDFSFAMESFLHFFFFFLSSFFPLFPSFPFVTLIRITFANHIYTSGELKCKMRRKSCEWFPRILEKKFLRFEEEDFIPLEPVTRLRVNFLLDREREMNFIFFFLYF